jgi:hypothetical protein
MESGDVVVSHVAGDWHMRWTYLDSTRGVLWTNGMVPCGPDMGFHMAPLCGIKFWLESMGVEPTTFGESGNLSV